MYQIFRKNWDKSRYLIISGFVITFLLVLTVIYKSDNEVIKETFQILKMVVRDITVITMYLSHDAQKSEVVTYLKELVTNRTVIVGDMNFHAEDMNDITISVTNLSKKYKLYTSNRARVKEWFHPLRKKYHSEFPDAVTDRGKKHLENLILANHQGYESYLLFLVQIEGCKTFNIASDIDPDYFKVLKDAVKKNVNVLCYDCKFSNKGIKINKKIDILLNDR